MVAQHLLFVGVSFFFFQAEDGIRDYKVTGVQTCALPISAGTLSGQPLMILPKVCERQAIQPKKRCNKTRTTLAPIDVKKPALPLMARERTDAKITSRIASNAVFSASERLLLKRTSTSVSRKMITPRTDICMNVSCFGSNRRPRIESSQS